MNLLFLPALTLPKNLHWSTFHCHYPLPENGIKDARQKGSICQQKSQENKLIHHSVSLSKVVKQLRVPFIQKEEFPKLSCCPLSDALLHLLWASWKGGWPSPAGGRCRQSSRHLGQGQLAKFNRSWWSFLRLTALWLPFPCPYLMAAGTLKFLSEFPGTPPWS